MEKVDNAKRVDIKCRKCSIVVAHPTKDWKIEEYVANTGERAVMFLCPECAQKREKSLKRKLGSAIPMIAED